VSRSCALLGGFAIGDGLRCYDNIARTLNVIECSVLALCLVLIFAFRRLKDEIQVVAPIRAVVESTVQSIRTTLQQFRENLVKSLSRIRVPEQCEARYCQDFLSVYVRPSHAAVP